MEREIPIVEIPIHGVGPYDLVIAQGFHGPYHRRDPSPMRLDYAVDLATPIGSIVVAAREGVVAGLLMGSDVFCDHWDLTPDEITKITRFTANWILVDHGDMQSLYSHLRKGGAFVHEGQRVSARQPIGITDDTGWTPFHHLHFHLHRWVPPAQRRGAGRNETIPFRFRGYDGPMENEEIPTSISNFAIH